MNIKNMEDALCDGLRITDSITDAECLKSKEDDIMLETKMLVRNKEVQDIFETCTKENYIDIRSSYQKK